MSGFTRLQVECSEANKRLFATGIVDLTFGNVSVADRTTGKFAIKPSGVSYDEITPESTVLVDIEGGPEIELRQGSYRPSSDTPTHRRLYQSFLSAGCIVHTHSRNAAAFAQAGVSIPCLGTTHADYFRGPVPVTRFLTEPETAGNYEWETGRVIVEAAIDPDVRAVLVRGHGAFVWGPDWESAVEGAVALELVAELALKTLALSPDTVPLEQTLIDRHFLRKHGPGAYYGQPKDG